ncbi:MAG: hypothetical protein IJC39_04595, partial [Firmicutes bacterium]|nr:hypothetical protein [Bacillota bacterium]
MCSNNNCGSVGGANTNKGRDCIVAMKIYDQCRIQLCLTPTELGPARAAETKNCCGETIHEGDAIVPPANSTSVSIDKLRLKRIFVTNKTQNAFRPGYWDVEVKFMFIYRLVFRTSDNCEICRIWAVSSYKTKITLFGSLG